ncbi:hypothetical protein BDF19DRAFT_426360 [Syncephalis fuscata]|nr:hypothetical protein BDF19DRAFT_426360 [Syncephalis fuscata]
MPMDYASAVVSAGTITSDRQTLLRRADCPAGQTFCDKFGCVAGIRCPHACAYFDSMQACDRIQVNGNKCVWWGSQCIPNVQCSMVNGQCSDDCNLCGVYGCVPRGNKCPQACEAFTNTNNCNQHLASNGINCQWNTQRNMCGYAVGATPLDQLQFSPSAIGGSHRLHRTHWNYYE